MVNIKLLPTKSSSPLLILLLLATGFNPSYAQTLLVSNHTMAVQSEKHLTLKQALAEIELKYKIVFSYESDLIKNYAVSNDEWQLQKTPDEALLSLLKPFNLIFEKIGKNIIIIKSSAKASGHPSASKLGAAFPNSDESLVGLAAGTIGSGENNTTVAADRVWA